MEIWYKICQIIGRAIIWLWFVKIEGELPPDGALVAIANHRRYLDSVLMGIILTRRVWFLAKTPVFRWLFIGWLIRKSNWALPVAKKSLRSIRDLNNILKQGGMIMLFPEGSRNKTREPLKKFERSFAKFAIENRAPVVPIAIIYKKLWWLPTGVKIKIGKPILINDVPGEPYLIATAWHKIYSLLIGQG